MFEQLFLIGILYLKNCYFKNFVAIISNFDSSKYFRVNYNTLERKVIWLLHISLHLNDAGNIALQASTQKDF